MVATRSILRYWFECKSVYIGGMYTTRHQRLVRVPAATLVQGADQVFPFPVEHEDDGLSTLALTIRAANGDDITSLEWHGDPVITGPIVDPGGASPEIDMAILAAQAVATGFTARAVGNTAFFVRDDGERVGGYGGIDLVMTGTSSIVSASAVVAVIQDVSPDTSLYPVIDGFRDQRVARAEDPDGALNSDGVHGINSNLAVVSTKTWVLDLATYSLHESDGLRHVIGGARTEPVEDWVPRKHISHFVPEPATRSWVELDAITGGPTEWGDEHPFLWIPSVRASGRVVNLDTVDPAYINGVQINPGEFHEFDCIREPFIVTPSPDGCRVEWYYEED